MLKEEYNESKTKTWLRDFVYTYDGHMQTLHNLAMLEVRRNLKNE
tara:strand:- start:345 stop:479 length:135 start_codon:yes stop_codon:yes gene_type:complete